MFLHVGHQIAALTVLYTISNLQWVASKELKDSCATQALRLRGHILTKPDVVTPEECLEKCEAQSQCQAWAFNNHLSVCELMSMISGTLHFAIDPNFTSGLTEGARECPIKDGKRCYFLHQARGSSSDSNIASELDVADVWDCERACEDVGCVYFNFYLDTGICEYFKSLDGLQPYASYNTLSGAPGASCEEDDGFMKTKCNAGPPFKGYVHEGSPVLVEVEPVTIFNYVCRITEGMGNMIVPDFIAQQVPQVCQKDGSLTIMTPACFYPSAWAAIMHDEKIHDVRQDPDLKDDISFVNTLSSSVPVSYLKDFQHYAPHPMSSVVGEANFLIVPPVLTTVADTEWPHGMNPTDVETLAEFVREGGVVVMLQEHRDMPWMLTGTLMPAVNINATCAKSVRADPTNDSLVGMEHLAEKVMTSDEVKYVVVDPSSTPGAIVVCHCEDAPSNATVVYVPVPNLVTGKTGGYIWTGWNGDNRNRKATTEEQKRKEFAYSNGPGGWTETLLQTMSLVAQPPPYRDKHYSQIAPEVGCVLLGANFHTDKNRTLCLPSTDDCLNEKTESGVSEEELKDLCEEENKKIAEGRPCSMAAPPCKYDFIDDFEESCEDNIRNGYEEGVDCGRSCEGFIEKPECDCDMSDYLALNSTTVSLSPSETAQNLQSVCPDHLPIIVPSLGGKLEVTCKSTGSPSEPISARCISISVKVAAVEPSIFGNNLTEGGTRNQGPVTTLPSDSDLGDIVDENKNFTQVMVPRVPNFTEAGNNVTPVLKDGVAQGLVDFAMEKSISIIDQSGEVLEKLGPSWKVSQVESPSGLHKNPDWESELDSFVAMLSKRGLPEAMEQPIRDFVTGLPDTLPQRPKYDTVDITHPIPTNTTDVEPLSFYLYTPSPKKCEGTSNLPVKCPSAMTLTSVGSGLITHAGIYTKPIVDDRELDDLAKDLGDPYQRVLWDSVSVLARAGPNDVVPLPPGGDSSSSTAAPDGERGTSDTGLILGIVGGSVGALMLVGVTMVGIRPYSDPSGGDPEPEPMPEEGEWDDEDVDVEAAGLEMAGFTGTGIQEMAFESGNINDMMADHVLDTNNTRAVAPPDAEVPVTVREAPTCNDTPLTTQARGPEVTGVQFQQTFSTLRSSESLFIDQTAAQGDSLMDDGL